MCEEMTPHDRYLYRRALSFLQVLISKNYGKLKRRDYLELAGCTRHTREVWMILFSDDAVEYSPGDLFGSVNPANDELFDRAVKCADSFPFFMETRKAFNEGVENELPF